MRKPVERMVKTNGINLNVVEEGQGRRRVGEESINTFRVPLSVSAVSDCVPV